MSRFAIFVACFGVVALAGCEKKETPPPAAESPAVSPSPAASTVPAAAPAAEATVDVASLPVEEQYEAEAEKELTPDNLSAKLDELEKEIQGP